MTSGDEPIGDMVPRGLREGVASSRGNVDTSPPSSELVDQILSFADGKVVVYGDASDMGERGQTRTEIDMGDYKVIVHKNRQRVQTSGLVVGAARYNKLEVRKKEGNETSEVLDIKNNPQSSASNPSYFFTESDSQIGEGYGSRMDIAIAEYLYDRRISDYTGDFVDQSVVGWIRKHLK